MRVLITGGFGYLGGRIGQHLESIGHSVILASRKLRPVPDWCTGSKIATINWDDFESINAACAGNDAIIHTAGMNAAACLNNPKLCIQFRENATKNLLIAAAQNSVQKFFYVSSAHVYRQPLSGTINEASPTTNNHPYALSHKVAEKSVLQSHIGGNVNAFVVRLANGFGAPTRPDADCWTLFTNQLIREIVLSRTMTIKGNSHDARNFVTMTDICRAFAFMLADKRSYKSCPIINIGDRNMSLLEKAELIEEVYFETSTMPIDFDKGRFPDTEGNLQKLEFQSNVIRSLGFQPLSDFRGELRSMIKFCFEHFGQKS